MTKPSEAAASSFDKLAAIDVSDHLDKKGPYSYLSWPFAVAELRKAEPTATWEVRRFDGLPYLQTPGGFYVEVAVTVNGVTLSQIHPVLDGKNRPIFEPTSFEINTSIQRCLVKAIALHGLGLSVYTGEDVPMQDQDTPPPANQPRQQRSTAPHKQVGSGLSHEQQESIRKLVSETGADMNRLLDFYNVRELGEIRSTQYDRVVRSLQHRRAA